MHSDVICKVLNDSLILSEGTKDCICFSLQTKVSGASLVLDSLCQVDFKYEDGKHSKSYYHIESIEEDNNRGYYRAYFKDDSVV